MKIKVNKKLIIGIVIIIILLLIYLVNNNYKNLNIPFIPKFYENGEKNGEWTGHYKNGKKNGEWIGYYGNGNIKYIKYYKDGIKDGEWKYYYENGNIKYIENYKDGNLNGERIEYDRDGNITYITNYKDGKLNGDWTQYYKNGEISEIEHFENGVLSGKKISFFEGGKIFIEENWKNGDINGERKRYREDGSIDIIENYKDGIKDGEWITYFNNGNIREIIKYDNGKEIETTSYRYYTGGQIGEIQRITETGVETTYYNEDGTIGTFPKWNTNENNTISIPTGIGKSSEIFTQDIIGDRIKKVKIDRIGNDDIITYIIKWDGGDKMNDEDLQIGLDLLGENRSSVSYELDVSRVEKFTDKQLEKLSLIEKNYKVIYKKDGKETETINCGYYTGDKIDEIQNENKNGGENIYYNEDGINGTSPNNISRPSVIITQDITGDRIQKIKVDKIGNDDIVTYTIKWNGKNEISDIDLSTGMELLGENQCLVIYELDVSKIEKFTDKQLEELSLIEKNHKVIYNENLKS